MLGIKYGETCPLRFTCKDKQGNPVDLTDATISFELYDEIQDDEPTVEKSITSDTTEVGAISDAKNGKFYVIFDDYDYELLYKGRVYYLTVWLIKGDCKKVISSVNGEVCTFKIFYP